MNNAGISKAQADGMDSTMGLEDIKLWPSGSYCYESQLAEYTRHGMGDDYETIKPTDPRYDALTL